LLGISSCWPVIERSLLGRVRQQHVSRVRRAWFLDSDESSFRFLFLFRSAARIGFRQLKNGTSVPATIIGS
jgi:hypothetical protein